MMPEYRAYIFNIDGHRFRKVSEFASGHRDDSTAIKAAETLVDGHDVELWDCARLVARFDHATHEVVVEDQRLANLKIVADQSLVPAVDVEIKDDLAERTIKPDGIRSRMNRTLLSAFGRLR
jgi:hypothetical protein